MSRELIVEAISESYALKKAGNRLLKQSQNLLADSKIKGYGWTVTPIGKAFGVVGFDAFSVDKKTVKLSVMFRANYCQLAEAAGEVTKVDIYIIKKLFSQIGFNWFDASRLRGR